MEVLDTTIANVALRHIGGSLAADQDESTWILTSYLVSNAVVLPVSGWLANVIGRKRFYMICVALFTASSMLCAMSTSLGMMLIGRVLQGVGGGGMAPTEQSMFADTFPPEKRAQAFALYGLTVVSAPAIGPVLGGWLTDNLSWHWVFLINLPVGLLSLTLVGLLVVEPEVLRQERRALLAKGLNIDVFGLILVFVGFGTLQILLDRYEIDDGFSSSFIVDPRRDQRRKPDNAGLLGACPPSASGEYPHVGLPQLRYLLWPDVPGRIPPDQHHAASSPARPIAAGL